MLRAIFASDQSRGFGYCGRLPWPKISEDMNHFRKVTGIGAIVMGRKTWESLPNLPHRLPILVSDTGVEERAGLIQIPRSAMAHIEKFGNYARYSSGRDVTIIGGTSLLVPEYLQYCEEIHHTEIKGTFEADTFIPKETVDFLLTLKCDTVLDNEKITIRKYYAPIS